MRRICTAIEKRCCLKIIISINERVVTKLIASEPILICFKAKVNGREGYSSNA
jgi:hypothetical protein